MRPVKKKQNITSLFWRSCCCPALALDSFEWLNHFFNSTFPSGLFLFACWAINRRAASIESGKIVLQAFYQCYYFCTLNVTEQKDSSILWGYFKKIRLISHLQKIRIKFNYERQQIFFFITKGKSSHSLLYSNRYLLSFSETTCTKCIFNALYQF